MATTVEAKTRQQAAAPEAAQKTPWYQAHQRAVLAALIVLAAAAVVGWFIVASGKRKEQFAARSLNQARAAAEAGNLPLASSELQRLVTTYKGTDAAQEAIVTLNQVRMVNGQNELAAVGLREFLGSKPDPKYVAPANGLLGSALENSKHWPEAAAAYMEASRASDVGYLKAKYLIDAGRAYREAGRTEDALRTYRTVIEKYADSPSFTEAQVRLAELTAGKM
jgi:outer membrane protein assembly factor BamD (BamD/ComL family)